MKLGWIIVAVIVAAGGIFLYRNYSENKKCEDQALVASVEEVNASQYPSTSERDAEQEAYQRRYVQACNEIR